MKLDISKDLKPLDASTVTQKMAFLGISGSGKTYAAGKLAEELLDGGAQVVIVDTVGNWWGLRLGAGGTTRGGIQIPILGGQRGDVPLEATAGAQVAELIAETRASLIVDVSGFTKGELRRFVTAFAGRLYTAKRQRPGPLMVIWEECQDVVPQFVGGEVAQMVGAVEELVKKGRNYGVGTVLLSQRPAAVNKDVLSQIETLFAFRATGPHDRKAIGGWVSAHAADAAKMVDALPKLKTGECFVWSPSWLEILDKVTIAKKRTFNSTQTPKFGETSRAGALRPVDLKKFESSMASAIEHAKDNDPKALRARADAAERKLADEHAHATALEREVARLKEALEALRKKKEKTVPALKDKDIKALQRVVDSIADVAKKLVAATAALDIHGGRIVTALTVAQAAEKYVVTNNGHVVAPSPPAQRVLAKHTETMVASGLGGLPVRVGSTPRAPLDGPSQRVLDALAWLNAIGIATPDAIAVAFMAGYSGENGAFNNTRGKLRTAGLVMYPRPGVVALTADGAARARPPSIAPTGEALRDAVLMRLEVPQRRVLEPVLRAYPSSVPAAELAVAAGYGGENGAFNNNRGRLRTLGLVTYPSVGAVRAADILFPEVRR